MTIEQFEKDIAEGKTSMIYYSSKSLWWTHLDEDLKEASETGKQKVKEAHEAFMNSDSISKERKEELQAFYDLGQKHGGIPTSPQGAPLYQMDDPKTWLAAAKNQAEENPELFGKGGLNTFMNAHHQNCGEVFSTSWAAYESSNTETDA